MGSFPSVLFHFFCDKTCMQKLNCCEYFLQRTLYNNMENDHKLKSSHIAETAKKWCENFLVYCSNRNHMRAHTIWSLDCFGQDK